MTTGTEVEKKHLAQGFQRKRVVSGMRPTGRLHIGHYFGALANWVHFQKARFDDEKEYECFYFIADWHALTSDYADTSAVAQNTIEITTDYLAAGIDPKESVIFQQSLVPEHAELHLLLSMVTPLSWLERVPTYKEAFENVKDKDLHTYGFLGYPCLQTADIVAYSEIGTPLLVPVGEDQVSHVELSREIVRRFNGFYGLKYKDKFYSFVEYMRANHGKHPREAALFNLFLRDAHGDKTVLVEEELADLKSVVRQMVHRLGVENFLEKYGDEFATTERVLEEPLAMLTRTPRIPGLDGRKMSKSYGNAITLSESDADIRAKTKVMKTDPARQRRTDPGNPDVCPVYDWHKLFSPAETLEWAATGCRSAGIGCIECKAKMADNLIQWIGPIRERRVEYEKNPPRVLEILDEGSGKARKVARETMVRVREAVFGWGKKRGEFGESCSAGLPRLTV